MILPTFFVGLLLLYALYKYLSRNFDYWQKQNVPYIKPTIFVGNFARCFTLKETLGESLCSLYNKFNKPYFGVYVLDKPFLVINDPQLIKHVLIQDFNYFSDRNVYSDEKTDCMTSYMLFFSKNPEWKYMRTKMTSILSSGKMKNMFPLITETGNDMRRYLDKEIANCKIFEVKEMCSKYSVNVITSCSFGLNAESFQNQNAPFKKHATQMFNTNIKNGFQQASYFIAHDFVKFFKLPFFNSEITSFMREVFWKTLEERERSLIKRHDVIDIIKEFKNQPIINDEFVFEGDKILAQAAQFYSAGFETVSATMSFALYEISFQPEIQTKLRSEIKESINLYGCVNYESIQNMQYLSMVVDETLRKYPVLSFLDRKCTKDYKLPGFDLVVSKGIPIYISIMGLHNDSKYYPNPQKFDPERFSKDNKEKITPYTYLPFGQGPRNCIGARFGLLSAKVGLVQILSNYEVQPCLNTPKTITFSPRSIFLTSTVGIPLRLRKICVE